MLAQPLRAGPVLLDKALHRHCKLADCPIACEMPALSYILEYIDPTVEAMALTIYTVLVLMLSRKIN